MKKAEASSSKQDAMGSSSRRNGRNPSGAESKAERSLRKLPIPSWCTRRRSNLPKTVLNPVPVQKTLSTWRTPIPYTPSDAPEMPIKKRKLVRDVIQDLYKLEISDKENVYDSPKRNSPVQAETSKKYMMKPVGVLIAKNNADKCSCTSTSRVWPTVEIPIEAPPITPSASNNTFDTSLPESEYPREKSGTFPKMSLL